MMLLRSTAPLLFSVALAACGGTTLTQANTTDGGGGDAKTSDAGSNDAAPGDTGPDASYLACMDPSGRLDASLKTCHSDTDCVIRQEQTDCCGTLLSVGVNTASTTKFDTCEAAWLAHFPGCGCASGQTKTEDGKTTLPNEDGGAPQVHCTDFTSNGGICLTYLP